MDERYAVIEEVKDVLKNNYCRTGYGLFFEDKCTETPIEVLYDKLGTTVMLYDDCMTVSGVTKDEEDRLQKYYTCMSIKLNVIIGFTHWLEIRNKYNAIDLDCKEYGNTDGLIKAFIKATSESEAKVQPTVYEYHD